MEVETGPLEWSLDNLNENDRDATISGVIFGQPTTRTVTIDQLRVCAGEPEPRSPVVDALVEDSAPTIEGASAWPAGSAHATELLTPEKPRRELDETLDDILFSANCLEAYGRRYARGITGAALNERLRDEIRLKGFLVLGGAPGSDEYARLCVPSRFDVILKERPTAEEPVSIEGLYFPAESKTRRRKRGRRGA